MCATPSGGPVIAGPFSVSLTTGGSFSVAAFLKKSKKYGGFSQKLTEVVWPFTVIVHVSFWLPNSLGTRIANTPCCWPASKWVGCP